MKRCAAVIVCAIGVSTLTGCRSMWGAVPSLDDPADSLIVLSGFEWETSEVGTPFHPGTDSVIVVPGDQPGTWNVFRSWDPAAMPETIIVDDTGACVRRDYLPRPPRSAWGPDPLRERLNPDQLGIERVPPGHMRMLRESSAIRTKDFRRTPDGYVIVSAASSNIRAVEWQTEVGDVLPMILDARMYNPANLVLVPLVWVIPPMPPFFTPELRYEYQIVGPTQLRVFEYDSHQALDERAPDRSIVYRLRADVQAGRLRATTDQSGQWLYLYETVDGKILSRHAALIRISEGTADRLTVFEEALQRTRGAGR